MIPKRFMEFLEEMEIEGEFEYEDGSPMTEDAKIALAVIKERQPVSTDERLPDEEDRVFWWHPRGRSWHLGFFHPKKGKYWPGFFQGNGSWHVMDGPTYWMETPPDPTREEIEEGEVSDG